MNKSESLVHLPSSEWLWWKQSSASPFSPRCGPLPCTGPSLSRSCDLAASHLEQGRSASGAIMPVYLLAWSPRPSVSTFPNLSLCCNVNLIIWMLQGFLTDETNQQTNHRWVAWRIGSPRGMWTAWVSLGLAGENGRFSAFPEYLVRVSIMWGAFTLVISHNRYSRLAELSLTTLRDQYFTWSAGGGGTELRERKWLGWVHTCDGWQGQVHM